MNTKQIVAIMAIVAVAVASVAGVAYAYQATLTNEGNYVESNFLELNAAQGSFAQKFSKTDLQWDSENTGVYSDSKAVMEYSPYGAATVVRNLTGTAVSDPYVITINSERMETGNWFQMSVQTNSTVEGFAGLNGAFALKYTYQYTPGTGDAKEYVDYVILTGTSKIPMFVSPIIAPAGESATAAANDNQKMTVQLYAIPYTGTFNAKELDYSQVDFVFTAETQNNGSIVPVAGTLTVTAQTKAPATDTGATAAYAYVATPAASAGARVCGAESFAGGVLTVTAPETLKGIATTFVGDALHTGYTYKSAEASSAWSSHATSVNTTETFTEISVKTASKTTFSLATATEDTKTKILNLVISENNYQAKYSANADLTDDQIAQLSAAVSENTPMSDTPAIGWYKVIVTLTVSASETYSTSLWIQVTA